MDFYKVGDYVLVNNYITDKMDIGRIVEMIEPSSSVSYILCYKPEQTHCGRLSYHGKNEIFKTATTNEESVSHIVSKVEVLRTQEYSKIPREEKFANDLFVCRQKYDIDEEKFSPELEPDCFCNRILNPDDDLVVCECDRLFHYQCINSDQNSCPTCDYFLMNVGDTLYKKRKIEEDSSVLLKSNQEEECYEMWANALDDVEKEKNTNQNKSYSYNRSLNEKRPLSALDLNRGNSRGSIKGPFNIKVPPKKQTRKELCNIDDDAFDRIKHAIANFSKAHQNKSMSDLDRSRYFLKEKYYKSLLYGIEEVKERQRLAGSYLHLSDNARRIAVTDMRENYKNAQNLALNIEAVVWHSMNKNKSRIDPNYSMKNRELLNYMMDDNNFELRLAVLVGDKKPEFLCRASGKELVSKEVSEKIEKKELKTLKLSLLPDEIKIIAKSHKGETVIEAENPESAQPTEANKEPEPADDDSDTLTELVHRIERRNSEPFDSAENAYYNDHEETPTFIGYKGLNKQKKLRKDQDEDGLSDSSDHLLGNNFSNIRKNKMSTGKNYEDPLASNAGANKLIDQDVLKNVMSFFFQSTYNKVTERIRNHLRPEIAGDILEEIDRKYQNE